jgi:hypothetical protein
MGLGFPEVIPGITAGARRARAGLPVAGAASWMD